MRYEHPMATVRSNTRLEKGGYRYSGGCSQLNPTCNFKEWRIILFILLVTIKARQFGKAILTFLFVCFIWTLLSLVILIK